jgi:predicted nucleic acid-binding protein
MRVLDSNIFIYHLAKDPRKGKRASEILQAVQDGEEAIIPSIVIVQVCSYLKWKKFSHAIPIFLKLLQSLPTLVKEETIFSDYILAISLQSKLNLPWNIWDDMVIASQMQRLAIHEIYSFDKDFDRITAVKRIS